MSEWLPTYADLSSSLLNQSIRNPKGKGVANKDRKSAADSSNNSLSPCAVSQDSRKQCQDERNPELAENNVPRCKRNLNTYRQLKFLADHFTQGWVRGDRGEIRTNPIQLSLCRGSRSVYWRCVAT
jgi:hypothetical protein